MFSWATSKLENIAQTVAPTPTDPESKFVHACQKQDEATALQLLNELGGDPVYKVVQKQKNQTALHVACLHSMSNVIQTILSQQASPTQVFSVTDQGGNNCLHCACMSNAPQALEVVKHLVNLSKESCGTKNYQNQTPYDVSVKSTVRQYLLPIQLQAETQHALDNGGVGLPPGIDLGGLKIVNSHLPPPPVGGMMPGPPPAGMAPVGGLSPPPPVGAMTAPPAVIDTQQPNTPATTAVPNPSMFTTPSPQPLQVATSDSSQAQVPRPPTAPSSTGSGYALRGRSSAAILKTKGIQPDGFHSSSSDKNLQEKYGHVSVTSSNLPPPPSSGNSVGSGGMPLSAPPSLGASANPYAGGLSALGSGGRRPAGRYVTYDPITGARPTAPRPAATTPAGSASPYSMFTPSPPSSSQGVLFNPAAAPAPFNPASAPAPFNPASAPVPAPLNPVAVQPQPGGPPRMEVPQKSRAATTGTTSFPRPPVMMGSTSNNGGVTAAPNVPSPSSTFSRSSSFGSASATFAKPNNSPDAKALFARPGGSTPPKEAATSLFARPPVMSGSRTALGRKDSNNETGDGATAAVASPQEKTTVASATSTFARPPGQLVESPAAKELYSNPAAAAAAAVRESSVAPTPTDGDTQDVKPVAADLFASTTKSEPAVSSTVVDERKEPVQEGGMDDEDMGLTDVPLTPGNEMNEAAETTGTLTSALGIPPPPFKK